MTRRKPFLSFIATLAAASTVDSYVPRREVGRIPSRLPDYPSASVDG